MIDEEAVIATEPKEDQNLTLGTATTEDFKQSKYRG